jgi:hypothetical protein
MRQLRGIIYVYQWLQKLILMPVYEKQTQETIPRAEVIKIIVL